MKNKFQVFKREIADGVAEAIKSQASIAYCTEVHTGKVPDNTSIINKIVAENKDQVDLFYLESVLVSTGWNKNDDVFTAQATWDARATPEDKQFNFMHDENDIIGHITGSYVLDKDGNRIDNAQVDAPPQFDIITQAVLYNSWSDPENKQRMEQIIAEIKDGKWFVSMECLFSGFDYALVDQKGTAQLLQRNEASAFLSKHLRAYGGTGEYEGYKVGRALRQISFSGKGLVSKPANPRSVILNSKSVAAFNASETDTTTTLSIGEMKMPDLEKQLEQAIADLAAARAENKTIKATIEAAAKAELDAKIKGFETTITEKTATVATLEDTVKTTQARVAELEDALKASQKALEDSKAALDDMKKKEKMEARKASLASVGMSDEDVTSHLASLGDLPDAAFESVIAAFKKFPPKKGKDDGDKSDETTDAGDKKDDKKDDKKTDATVAVTPDTVAGLQTAEAALVDASSAEDENAKARASMSDWMSSFLYGHDRVVATEAKAAAKKTAKSTK